NFVALGVISGLDGTVGLDALKSATEARAPRAHMAQNIKALDAGATMGRYIKEGKVVSPVELGQS
ncbi:MAG: hypothetical protein HYX90_02955, partial [Chloroflexi bacterium]|nr:hypothetical protein [Chloroflexota bacterium]